MFFVGLWRVFGDLKMGGTTTPPIACFVLCAKIEFFFEKLIFFKEKVLTFSYFYVILFFEHKGVIF